jgi:hypothetical protein
VGRINCLNGSFDDLIADLRKKSASAPQTIRKAVSKGGDVLAEEITKSIVKESVVDTGALMQSVKKGKPTVTGSGYKIEAWPQGMRRDKHHKKAERNETIGFVNEFGRKWSGTGKSRTAAKNGYKGRPFMENAAKAAEERVGDVMLEELERDLNG